MGYFNAGKDWRQTEKRVTENEMVGWHHHFSGHALGQTPGDGEGQGSLVCCGPWGLKELDTTWWLNNNNLNRGLPRCLRSKRICLPMQETQIWSLGWGDPLEKEIAIHSIILPGKIPRAEEPGGLYSPWGGKRVRHNLVTKQQHQQS